MEEDNREITMEEFLRERGIPDDTLEYFKNEKIDSATVLLMSEEELKQIIPKYGDRIAVLNFCKKYSSSRKKSLIEQLKEKLGSKKSADSERNINFKPRKKKLTRKVEIGWLCLDEKTKILRQVRTKFGGGTRRVSVDRNIKCKDILQRAKELFFPKGKSSKGDIEHFRVELFDYKHHKCDLDLTINEMYDISALTTLRFYLTTYLKSGSDSIQYDEDFFVLSTVTSEVQNISSTSSIEIVDQQSFNSRPFTRSHASISPYFEEMNENMVGNDLSIPDEFSVDHIYSPSSVADETFQLLQSPVVAQEVLMEEKIILHRGKVFKEFVEAVKNHEVNFSALSIEIILPNGNPEVAEDLGGVFRDAISEFWMTFYEQYTEGTDYKVPIIRHDFGEREWRAVAKILVGGYKREKYFPIKIAPIFFKKCFKDNIDKAELLQNFLCYVSETDRCLINTAMYDFENADFNDLIELCSTYKSKWLPSKLNIKELVEQIAEQEILQQSAFIIQCFSLELEEIVGNLNLELSYKELEPTVKNIISCLDVKHDIDGVESRIFNYLLKYLKESDENTRCSLLRFCTGSNLVNHRINIDFIDSEGFGRVPIAHTCSKLLQLPKSYKNYVEFRSELNSLFISGIWVMDLV